MDHPRNPPCGPPSQLVSFAPCGGNIQRIAVEHRCTEFAVLLAAYGVLLGRQCHQQELVIGIPVSQRQDPAPKKCLSLLGCGSAGSDGRGVELWDASLFICRCSFSW